MAAWQQRPKTNTALPTILEGLEAVRIHWLTGERGLHYLIWRWSTTVDEAMAGCRNHSERSAALRMAVMRSPTTAAAFRVATHASGILTDVAMTQSATPAAS